MKKRGTRERQTVLTLGPDQIDVHVGHRLRQARRLAGLNQTELGAHIGVSFQAVQKYERGDNRISASRMFMAAKVLQCGVTFFFEGIDPYSVASSGSTLGPNEVALIRFFRLITNAPIREELRRFIHQIGMTYTESDREVGRRQVS